MPAINVLEMIDDVIVVAVSTPRLEGRGGFEIGNDLSAVLGASPKVVVDLSLMEFIDSSGCGTLISCMKQSKAAGGDLKLCCPSPTVMGIFNVIRLGAAIEIYATREEAIEAFTNND